MQPVKEVLGGRGRAVLGGGPERQILTPTCVWRPGMASLANQEKRLPHLSHPIPARTFGTGRPHVGRHQTGTRPPFSPEPLLTVFPEAACSLFPQLFLQGHRRRVGGEGRQRRGHVGCSARIQEFVERGASLAKGPVCAGAV